MKSNLKWLIPIIVLYVVVGLSCFFYRKNVREEACFYELNIISANVQEGLFSADVIIKKAADCNDTAAIALSEFNLGQDNEKIQRIIHGLSYIEKVTTSIVCDNNGNGIDSDGKKVKFADDAVFNEVQSTYSKGGSGLVLVTESDVLTPQSIAVVSRITFADQNSGYLITDVYVSDLYERVFSRIRNTDRMGIISINGLIIAGNNVGSNMWDDFSYDINADTIKLNISQGKQYSAEVEGYGYVVVVPSMVTKGAAVAFLTYDQMKHFIRNAMHKYNMFVMALFMVITIFVLANLGIYSLGRFVRKLKFNTAEGKDKIDALTGLYNKSGFEEKLNQYLLTSTVKNGVLFAVRLDNAQKVSNEMLKIFGSRLSNLFRATDIYSRYSDSLFLVFLKEIKDEKDIRKQTDEMQLFLYDIRGELARMDPGTTISAGRALMPSDCDEQKTVIDAAVKAAEISKAEGRGSIIINGQSAQ